MTDRPVLKPMYLAEVQGLRTFAALMVAVYHIWLGRVSGGVDVFFVVSAYFMCSALMRRDASQLSTIWTQVAGTFRRIVPGQVVVIIATVSVAIWLTPQVLWNDQLRHALASLVFVENWNLADEGTNYLQAGLTTSPFQQFWALSLQAQLYVLIPFAVWAASALAPRLGWSQVRGVAVMLGGIFVLSFLYSLLITAADQPWAYFDTGARAWEFAAGGLLALAATHISMPARLASALGWICLFVLCTFGLAVDVSSLFPGYVALVPVVAASGVIVATVSGGSIFILRHPAIVRLGDISFAFYLWHWPLLIFAREITGSSSIGLGWGFGIILAAGLLSLLSTMVIEQPFRRLPALGSSWKKSMALTVALMVPAILMIGSWALVYQTVAHQAFAEARAVAAGTTSPSFDDVIPAAVIAHLDVPDAYQNGCHQKQRPAVLIECEYGATDADTVIALVGGSHSLQWLPALHLLGQEHGFRVINMTKSACFMAHDMGTPSCRDWNVAVAERLIDLKPDLVFTTATRPRDGGDYIPAEYLAAWSALEAADIEIFALRDNPWFNFDVPHCVERNGHQNCTVERDDVLSASIAQTEMPSNVSLGDLTDLYCEDETCQPVRDGILVYRDLHHVTATFARFHRAKLHAEMRETVDGLFQ